MTIDANTGWLVLRTSAPRTLPLSRSLAAAGFDVWTPMVTTKRRLPRRKTKVERDAPILPTFVFARAYHLSDLLRARTRTPSPHPPFSVFHYFGRIPLIADGQMGSLRIEEERAALAYAKDKDRERLAELKAKAKDFAVGESVTVPQSAFAGMTGVVESKKGKSAVIDFGGGKTITIGAWLLQSGQVEPVQL